MPEANLEAFSLEGKTPDQLEQRRREIIASYGPNAMSKIDDMSRQHLHELAAITAALRRRTTPTPGAKPRKAGKKTPEPKLTSDDLLSGF